MTTRRMGWAHGILFAALAATTAVGCGDDDDDDGGSGASSGTAGKGGSSGSVGKGGSSGSVGKGGTGGTAGKGGSGGSSGSSGGSAGTAGSSGGTSGAGGDAGGEGGLAGSAGDAGSGGSDVGGAGGEAAGMGGAAAGVGGEGGTPDTAGAGGETSAGPTCAGYCATILAACPAGGEHAQYPSEAQCLASCAAFPTDVTTGNSLACRDSHASLAATAGADPHCDHAGPAGVGMCGSNCEGYCSLMMTTCAGTYETTAACLTACDAVPANDFTNFVYPAPGGDTLSCRIAHATNAAAATTDPSRDSHCGHAAGMAPCAAPQP